MTRRHRCSSGWGSTARSCAPGRCTTGPTRRWSTTIVTAVFPIYFSARGGRGPRPGAGDPAARRRHDDRPGDHRGARPDAGRASPTGPASRSGCSACSCDRRRGGRADVLHRAGRLAAGGGAVHPREHRGQRQLRLLRLVPAAHRQAGGDGPGLDGRLRARLRRRRHAPCAQPGLDPEAGVVRPALTDPASRPSQATLPARLAFLSVAVWWLVFSIPLFRHVPEPPRDRRAGGSSLGGRVRAAGRDLPPPAASSARPCSCWSRS